MTFLKNKKGFGIIFGMIILIIVLFVFALINSLSFNIFDDIKPDVEADLNSTEAKLVLNTTYNNFPALFDSLILFVLVGIWAVGLLSAFVSDEHPVLFGFMMIAVIFTIIAGMFLGNSYEEIMQDSDLTDMPSQFPISFYILSNMMNIGIGVAITMFIVRFGKNRL